MTLSPNFDALKPVSPPDRPHATPEAPNGTNATPTGRYLLLSGLQLERNTREIHCRVHLTHDGHSYYGEAHEMDSPSGRARAAARATLAAAEQVADDIRLGLEGVAVLDLFARKFIAVSVEAARDRHFLLLAGMVTLEPTRTIEDAAVLATLRAIDRWIAG